MSAIIVSAAWGLRRYARSAAVLVFVSGFAIGAAGPAIALGPALRLEPIASDGWGISWTSNVAEPNAGRAQALASLVEALTVSSACVMAAALLTVLSLSVARAGQRRSEIVVRRSVGASRRTLRGSAVVEGLALALSGAALGAGLAVTALRVLAAQWPGAAANATAWPPIVFTLGLGAIVVVGALFPLGFARHRTPGVDATSSPVPLLVPAVQLGLGLLGVIAGAQLAGRSWVAVPPPPSETGTLVSLTLRDSSPARRTARYQDLLRSLGPRFVVASLASPGTHLGLGTVDYITTQCGHCADGGLPNPWPSGRSTVHLVSADTFHAMGIRVLEGRAFTSGDEWRAARVAVVSRSLADKYFENGRAIGRRVRVGAPDSWYTVVGIVEDGRFDGVGAAAQPRLRVYLSAFQHPTRALELLVRAREGERVEALPAFITAALGEGVVGRSEPEQAVRAREADSARWFAVALRGLGAAAVVIALCGMMAVMRLWMRAAIPEIALRRAVGARRHHVLGRVLARTTLVLAGGTAIAWWLEPLLQELLRNAVPGVPAAGLTLAGAPLALLALATVGVAVTTAWHAVRVPPAALPGFADL
jgi:putative ABC transport system permease protein